MSEAVPDLLFVDAHVHLHACFDPVAFMEAAYANFNRAAQLFHLSGPFIGMLLLTEGARENGFNRLLDLFQKQKTAGDTGLGQWCLHDTQEDTSLYLTSNDGGTLVVVAGRQIVSQERLEVLAVGTRETFEEGEPIDKVIRDVAYAGALPIIPWGFGKWIGERGQRLRQVLQQPDHPPFFMGDSANRPAFWPQSTLFRLAEEKGIRNLPGSDPLPFPDESRRPGSFGCILEGALDMAVPTRDLKEKLLDPRTSIHHFGRGERPFRFVRNQLAMQYRKLTHP